MSLDPITAGIDLVTTFVGKYVKDKDLAAKLMAEANSQEMAGEINARLGQLRINEAEAKHSSVFVSGWRPAVGWCAALGLGANYLLFPLLEFIVVIAMDNPPAMPSLDIGELITLLIGMLGLSGIRMNEKVNRVARS